MVLHGTHVVVVIPLFAIISTVYSSQENGCAASAHCMSFQLCPSLVRLNYQENVNLLRSLICEMDKNNNPSKLCCTSSVLPSQCGRRGLVDRIVNGENAPIFGWPWIALLEGIDSTKQRSKVVCGGVLISDRYVLTAAHCVNDSIHKVNKVILGEHTIGQDPDCVGTVCSHMQKLSIDDIIIHEDYDTVHGCRNCHDIALIRLNARVELTQQHVNAQSDVWNVQPICLPQNFRKNLGFSQNELLSKEVWVAGWGTTEKEQTSRVLQQLQVTIKPQDECQGLHIFPDRDAVLCAGITDRSTCTGDSGGPMVIHTRSNTDDVAKYYLIGIVVGGSSKCAAANSGGTRYISVSYYVDWIISKLRR